MESHIVRKLGNRTIQDVRNNQISTIPQNEFDRLIPLHSRTRTGRFDPSGPILRRDALLSEIFPIITGSEFHGASFLDDTDLSSLAETNSVVLERVLENPKFLISEQAQTDFIAEVRGNNFKAVKIYLDKGIISKLPLPGRLLTTVLGVAIDVGHTEMVKFILSYPNNQELLKSQYMGVLYLKCVTRNNFDALKFLWDMTEFTLELDYAMNEACRINLTPFIEFLADRGAPLQCNSYSYVGNRKQYILLPSKEVQPVFNQKRVNRESIFYILKKNEDYKCMQLLKRIFRHERYARPDMIKDQLSPRYVHDDNYKCPILCALTFRRYDVIRYILSLSEKGESLIYPYTASIFNLAVRMESEETDEGFSAPFDIITEIFRQALHDITPETLKDEMDSTGFIQAPSEVGVERPYFFVPLTPNDFRTFAELTFKLGSGKFREQSSPLIYSIIKNSYGTRVTRFLLDNGADPNFDDSMNTPLSQACRVRSLETVQLLLSKGADPNKAESNFTRIFATESVRSTPLLLAIKSNSFAIVKTLIENGARGPYTVEHKNFNLPSTSIININILDCIHFDLYKKKAFNISELTEILKYLLPKGVVFRTYSRFVDYINLMFDSSEDVNAKFKSGDYSLLEPIKEYYKALVGDDMIKQLVFFTSLKDTAEDAVYELKLKYFITQLNFNINYIPRSYEGDPVIDPQGGWPDGSPILFYAIAEAEADKVEILLRYGASLTLEASYIKNYIDDTDDYDYPGHGQKINAEGYAEYWRAWRGKNLTDYIKDYLEDNPEDLTFDEQLAKLRAEDDFKEQEYNLREADKIVDIIKAAKRSGM
jgi:ankyrin repeat protein